MDRLARRRAKDYAAKAISTGFALLSLFMLAWILYTLIERGLPALGSNVFTQRCTAGRRGRYCSMRSSAASSRSASRS